MTKTTSKWGTIDTDLNEDLSSKKKSNKENTRTKQRWKKIEDKRE